MPPKVSPARQTVDKRQHLVQLKPAVLKVLNRLKTSTVKNVLPREEKTMKRFLNLVGLDPKLSTFKESLSLQWCLYLMSKPSTFIASTELIFKVIEGVDKTAESLTENKTPTSAVPDPAEAECFSSLFWDTTKGTEGKNNEKLLLFIYSLLRQLSLLSRLIDKPPINYDEWRKRVFFDRKTQRFFVVFTHETVQRYLKGNVFGEDLFDYKYEYLAHPFEDFHFIIITDELSTLLSDNERALDNNNNKSMKKEGDVLLSLHRKNTKKRIPKAAAAVEIKDEKDEKSENLDYINKSHDDFIKTKHEIMSLCKPIQSLTNAFPEESKIIKRQVDEAKGELLSSYVKWREEVDATASIVSGYSDSKNTAIKTAGEQHMIRYKKITEEFQTKVKAIESRLTEKLQHLKAQLAIRTGCVQLTTMGVTSTANLNTESETSISVSSATTNLEVKSGSIEPTTQTISTEKAAVSSAATNLEVKSGSIEPTTQTISTEKAAASEPQDDPSSQQMPTLLPRTNRCGFFKAPIEKFCPQNPDKVSHIPGLTIF